MSASPLGVPHSRRYDREPKPTGECGGSSDRTLCFVVAMVYGIVTVTVMVGLVGGMGVGLAVRGSTHVGGCVLCTPGWL